MLKMSTGIVLASLRGSRGLAPALPVPVPLIIQGQSPVRRVTVPFARCGLAGWPFWTSCKAVEQFGRSDSGFQFGWTGSFNRL